MPTPNLPPARNHSKLPAITLGLLCLAIAGLGYLHSNGQLEGALVRRKVEYPWKSITPQQVMSGVTIPANTNVVFHLPEAGFTRITRETLLGLRGKDVRYWGYCFPANYDPTYVNKRSGFPGLIFLSEQERVVRAAAERKPRFTVSHLPTAQDIEEMAQRKVSSIRHQLNVFEPATMCFIMTEAPLAMGLDPDNDRLNDQLERKAKTDPKAPDTDGDGISDGVEYLYETNPIVRDSDGDGIIDGIEDKDWDGRIDHGETDPRSADSDRDNLCDGMCRTRLKGRDVFMGEDKNLNGTMDEGESNPNKWDTNGDGISDEIDFLRCIAQGKDICP